MPAAAGRVKIPRNQSPVPWPERRQRGKRCVARILPCRANEVPRSGVYWGGEFLFRFPAANVIKTSVASMAPDGLKGRVHGSLHPCTKVPASQRTPGGGDFIYNCL
jgi:hypothetical protein